MADQATQDAAEQLIQGASDPAEESAQTDQSNALAANNLQKTSAGVSSYGSNVDPAAVARANASIDKLGHVGSRWEKIAQDAAQSQVDIGERGVKTQETDYADYKKQNDAMVKPLQEEAATRTKEYDKAVDAREKFRVKAQQQIDMMDSMAKQIATEHVHDFWADRSTGNKITYVLGAMLGGAAQAFYGDRTNPVVEMVDKAVQQDLMMQRLRMEKRKEDYSNRNLLLGKFMDFGIHTQEAQDKAYVTAMNGVVGRLQAAKQLLTTPEQRMKVDQAITNIQMKTAAAQQNIAMQMVGKDFQQANAEAHLNAQMVTATKTVSGASEQRAQTAAKRANLREEELNLKKGQIQSEKDLVDWEPADERGFIGTKQDFSNFRKAESAATTVTDRMDKLVMDLKKGRIKNLTQWGNYSELQQDIANLIEAAKQPGLVNTGANFQGIEKTLIEKGYMADNGDLLDPQNAARLIMQKEHATWKEVANKAHQFNAKPRKSHPIFGGGK